MTRDTSFTSAHEYGIVQIRPNSVTISAHSGHLYAWTHRAGSVWPCSRLDDLETIAATFDAGGLVDLTQVPEPSYWRETGAEDIPAAEFNAWSSDVLRVVRHRRPV